jgi:ankyrin repeat protein
MGQNSSSVLPPDEQRLMAAARTGNVGVLVATLEAGAFINCRGNNRMTPLIAAAANGHAECVLSSCAVGLTAS